METLKRKTALITGGTSGIGLASARIFLDNGYDVAIVGRSEQKGVKALSALSSRGRERIFLRGDISKARECERLVAETAAAFGGVDTLVNSAGIYFERAITDTGEADYDLVMDTNVRGAYFMCRYAIPHLKKSAAGAIVNVSSDAGVNGNYFCSAYCASKGAVTVLTKALALELASANVRVNCVLPGDVDTPMTRSQLEGAEDPEEQLRQMRALYPLGRIGSAEEVAEVVYFLASEKAAFVTGAAWGVDGGLTAY